MGRKMLPEFIDERDCWVFSVFPSKAEREPLSHFDKRYCYLASWTWGDFLPISSD